jgi:hypothetical protein
MTVTIDNELNATSAGGGTPGGADTNVQYNDGGALGGEAAFTYTKGTNTLQAENYTGTTAVLLGSYTTNQAVDTTSTDGVVLATTSTATVGAQKYSPRLRLRGSGWKTNATAAAQSVDWAAEVRPVQGSAAPTANLVFSSSINGGAYADAVSISSGQGLVVGATSGTGSITINNAGFNPTMITIPAGFTGVPVVFSVGGTNVMSFAGTGNQLLQTLGLLMGSSVTSGADLILKRGAAANLQLGDTAANPAVAQTLSVQDASGTDIAGAAWTFRGSRGTGTGTPGSILFQTSTALGTGTTLQTASTRLTISATAITGAIPFVLPSYTVANLPTGSAGMRAFVTDSNATTFAAVVAGGGANGVPVYHDGTNWRIG